jgi:hypothetical protein
MLKCLVIEDHKDKGIAANIINQALDEYTRMVEVSLYDINYIKHNYISDHFDFVVLIHDNTIYHKYHVESISERTTDKEMRDQPLHYYREGEVPIFDFMSLSFSSFISAYDISVSYSPSSKTPCAYSTDFCHPVQRKIATQSMGMLPPSPEDFCHPVHGMLPPSERSDAGLYD